MKVNNDPKNVNMHVRIFFFIINLCRNKSHYLSTDRLLTESPVAEKNTGDSISNISLVTEASSSIESGNSITLKKVERYITKIRVLFVFYIYGHHFLLQCVPEELK